MSSQPCAARRATTLPPRAVSYDYRPIEPNAKSGLAKFRYRKLLMNRKRVSKAIVHQPAAQFYDRFVEGIKQRIRVAQIKAAISANRELILLYWDIGRAIVDAQKDKGYGKRVVEILSADLRREFPDMAGLSALNLWRMRAFYLAYAVSDQKLSQLVTESDSAPKRKLKQPALEARGAA